MLRAIGGPGQKMLVLAISRVGPELKEGPDPEWSRSQFFNKRLLCLFLPIIITDCSLQACYNITFKCAILLHRKS